MISVLTPTRAFDLIAHLDHVPIMTSRGALPNINDRFRRRDPVRVTDEILYWHNCRGIRNFSFYDDTLLVNPKEMAIPLLKRDHPQDPFPLSKWYAST